MLNNEQRERILTAINPYLSPLKEGYQVIQSMISIGSGGVLGKGLGEGTQTHLRFLPVRDTDFIISSIGESFGFLTILLIISIYLFLLYWLLNYAQKSRNNFLSLLVIGYLTILLAHIFITLGIICLIFAELLNYKKD